MVVGLMEHYLATLKLKSPAIIPRRRSARGYTGVKDTIPGSTVGGAILAWLRRHNKVDIKQAEELAKSGGIVSSPAFPRKNNKLYYPAHPFIWKCKDPECGAYVTTIERVLNELESGKELDTDIIPSACGEGHRSLEKLQRPLPASILLKGVNNDKDTKSGQQHFESVRHVSVPVSRHRASSIVGALYSYEALPTGLEYWAIVSIKEGIMGEGNYEIRIGRGVSRGFGKAELRTKKIDIDRLLKTMPSKRGHMVFYALSPVAFREGESVIDLSVYRDLTGKPSAGLVRVRSVYGYNVTVGGWDVRRNTEWRLEGAASPGSLVAAELEGGGEDIAYGLVQLGLLGNSVDFGGMRLVGLNIMLPAKIVLGDVFAS